ncbi:sigma-70 family RNA polymerase sigma factor [Fodinibius sp.]|uniref:sigma-70 family RNA polymerase sigma factor n=1 Tax=Fodinibius sp. TaxID=1872440 RepID=UPI002ACD3F84|nr:sigma-70 family RNA polymerase sigma factor [Fodinibius sp.]MDZ7658718.1 sigma-70 family RNA polymerase sigma factor [Fodinibius sp.]
MTDNQLNTELLWQKFSDQVRGFIRSKVSSDEVAEDILQDIFIRIHEGIGNLKHEDRVQSWVFGIAHRALADYYRQEGRDKEEPAGPDIKTGGDKDFIFDLNEFEGEHDVHEEVLSWLIPMIDELSEKYGKPLKMADVEGKKQQEVADHLGLSLSGVKSRVQRARQKLGEVLAACCEVQFGEEGRAVAYHKFKDESGEEPCEDC